MAFVYDRLKMDSKVAVVTGGGRGIGKAIALGLSEAGAKVVIGEIDAYRRDLRSAALAHFGCDGRVLDLREAYAIFRLCAGPVRELRQNWAKRIDEGLTLASEVLAEGTPNELTE